ncbi:uncharacterized protein A4U43_C01F17060 [Asparagus officinalis]|uniref:Pectinesterase inhibitor domain-containing protein n=1 Tax=Asparagus officinalis TaxID=4686 RepID=A0A5P1EIZ3_ASPOF|nr:21 kDa protein-like [Asparagus officinalis]XP_020275003.1 21 kDa protein-like [Asparagus officinalis]ONK64571.1 uncharacterized protein A4U43_C07F27480 [Asparagus officinalis]ONK80382.1 uncharacterized protein A4U43_C01F17060 [Asparagus officinalis]
MKRSVFKPTLSLLITALHFSFSIAARPTTPNSFIIASCKPTSYPAVCIESLSGYAPAIRRSPRLLTRAALLLSATRARETFAYISTLSSRPPHGASVHSAPGALQDCSTTMSDSADNLQRSMQQLRHLGRPNGPSFTMRLENVQTWLSAALTDQSMCLMSLLQEESLATENGRRGANNRLHWVTRKKVVEVSRVTSNALALVNELAW